MEVRRNLNDFGYALCVLKSERSYVLVKRDSKNPSEAKFNFDSLTSSQVAKRIAEITHAPLEVVEEELASLAVAKDTLAKTKIKVPRNISRIENKSKVVSESEEEQVGAISSFFNDNGVFVPKLLGEEILKKHSFITLQDSKEIFVYEDGVYEPIGEVVIKQDCRKFLVEEYRKSRVSEAVDYIQTATFTERKEEPLNLIPVGNGILNLNTIQLEEYSTQHVFFNKLSVDYDPSQDCPLICKFFEEITHDKDDIKTLIEIIGFCLYREYFIEKALMLVGSGGNGKSTFLNLVRAFLGKKNVSGRGLQELEENRFAKADLFAKLANIYADLPDRALRSTGIFKMLTGRDLIVAEKKFLNSFSFINYAKLLFSTNKVPEVHDDTDAFFRRWIIIVFDKVFCGKSRDPHILEKLTTNQELSGLLNLALAGLKNLLKRGDFASSKSTQTVKEEYVQKSSPVSAFVMELLEADSNAFIEKKELYQVFLACCREKKLPTVARDTFFKKIIQDIEVTDYRPEIQLDNQKTLRMTTFKGVRYKPVPSTASMVSRGFYTLFSLSSLYSDFTFPPWKKVVYGKQKEIIRIEIAHDAIDGLDGNQPKTTLDVLQRSDEDSEHEHILEGDSK